MGVRERRHRPWFVVGYDSVGNFHGVKQCCHHAALRDVLWLVLDAWLAAPAHHEHHRNSVDRTISEREQRINGVADSRILQVHKRGVLRAHVVAECNSDRRALVRRDDVAASRELGHDVLAEGLQETVGNSDE